MSGKRSFFNAAKVFESLRHAEYDVHSGLGELVDNSVEAEAQTIWVYVKASSHKKPYVEELAVVDDGVGMSADTLDKALVLGENARIHSRKPIGRFGVGLTLGGISLARRIDIYSREHRDQPFMWTYLDLDMLKDGYDDPPPPEAKEPPAEYVKCINESSGTIVVLSKCDRIPGSASTAMEGMANYLGRTYRKFISDGLRVYLNDEPVYLHDPLYLMTPTRFHVKNPKELTAEERGVKRIPMPIPDKPGQTADVVVRISLLPKAWREDPNAGGSKFAQERRIDENEGVSILRANREVYYGWVPRLIGRKGVAEYLDIDRWWGCEISFPPELDQYFEVRYIKRRALPNPELTKAIRLQIWQTIDDLRKEIRGDIKQAKLEREKKKGIFSQAEELMGSTDRTLPLGKRGADLDPKEAARQVRETVKEMTEVDPRIAENTDETARELETKPYAIAPVRYPESILFETVHRLGHIIVKLNINHPFYTKVFEPLCGSIAEMDENSDVYKGADTDEKRLARDALLLLLLSYAKAESFFEQEASLLASIRAQWGLAAKVAFSNLPNAK